MSAYQTFPRNFGSQAWLDKSKIDASSVPRVILDRENTSIEFFEKLQQCYAYNFRLVCEQFQKLVESRHLVMTYQCIERLADPEGYVINIGKQLDSSCNGYNLYVLNFAYTIANNIDWGHVGTLVRKYRKWYYRSIFAHDKIEYLK